MSDPTDTGQGKGKGRLHIAGPLEDGLQACSRCGYILKNMRGVKWFGSQRPLTGFEENSYVSVEERPGSTYTFAIAKDRLADSDTPPICDPGIGALL